MAKDKYIEEIEKGVIKLTPEDRKRLTNLLTQIEKMKTNIEKLKKMGQDVSELEAKIEKAIIMRDMLLKEF